MTASIGLDYGLRRVGIAASDDDGVLAFALETHVAGRDGSLFNRLRQLIGERDAKTLVVGLPLTADGRETDMAGRVRAFAARLDDTFELDIVLWDERYSSQEADRRLAGRRRTTREDRDAEAAALILQGFLDRQAVLRRSGNGENDSNDGGAT